MNLIIAATILAGLPLDQHWARFGQLAVSVAAWAVCAMLWMRSEPRTRRALAACLVIATLGEVFLSLGWGVYRYRLGNIPLFVPPGHVLLFFLGTQIARRLPARGEWAVAVLALPVVALFAWSGRDTLGPLLYALFLLCLWLSPSRRLYATMFVLSLAMELYGTWIGNAPPAQAPMAGAPRIIDRAPRLQAPLLGLFGAEDQTPSPAQVAELEQALKANGKTYEFHSYEGAGHGFFAADRPSYHAEAAADGHLRILTWLRRYLAG